MPTTKKCYKSNQQKFVNKYAMLKKEIINDPTAIKTYVTDKIAKLQVQQLNEEDAMFLLNLLAHQDGTINVPENEKPFLYRIIEQRLANCFTFVIDDSRLILYLAYISKSAGNAIMYLWYLQNHCKEKNIKTLNLDELCLNVFPWGYPTEPDLQTVWDGQKINREDNSFTSDNLVDYLSAGVSIQF